MEELDPVGVFAPALSASGIDYMIVGSVAAIAYGDYRHTNDVDVVLAFQGTDVLRLAQAFPDDLFYRPPDETLQEEAARQRRGHFNLIHHATGFRADCYIQNRDPLELWGFRHRREHSFAGIRVWIAPPELVILRKLEFFREGGSTKHLTDIRAMLDVTEIDHGMIESQVASLQLEEEWRRCQ